jgi:putative molybdopterin biosynthesis protein
MNVLIEFKLQTQPADDRVTHPLFALLQAVNEAGSIRLAAKNLKKSYRNVWGHLKSWEEQLGASLIVWGATGKGVTLTPQALRFLDEQEKIQRQYAQYIHGLKQDLQACVTHLMQN